MNQENEHKPTFKRMIMATEKTGAILIPGPDGSSVLLTNQEKRTELPNMLVDSILPYFENVFDKYRNTLAVDRGFWTDLSKHAKFTSIKAAHMARKAGYSAEDLADVALSRIQEKSGNKNLSSEKVTDEFLDDLEFAVRELFNAPDEVLPTEQITLLKAKDKSRK